MKDANWTQIKRSEAVDVQDVFWTSFIHLIYAMFLAGYCHLIYSMKSGLNNYVITDSFLKSCNIEMIFQKE